MPEPELPIYETLTPARRSRRADADRLAGSVNLLALRLDAVDADLRSSAGDRGRT